MFDARFTGWRAILSITAILIAAMGSISKCSADPAQEGLRFNRLAGKTLDTLAPKAGGPTERIEVQSTDDHIDYVVKAYKLSRANSSEVYQLIVNAVALEGGAVDRIAMGSIPRISPNGEVKTPYEGASYLIVTMPEWMIPYVDQTIEQLDISNLESSAFGTGTAFVHPKHRRPSELASLVAESVASGVEVFVPDDSRNLLYVEDTPSYLGGIMDALANFDQPPVQMEARIRIYEIDDQDAHDIGLDWYAWKKSISGGELTIKHSNENNSSSYSLDLDSITSELTFNPLIATEFLNYLATNGRAEVITDTRVRVINGETGSVESTLQIPYVLRGFVENDVADSPLRDSPEALDGDRLIREFLEGVVIRLTPTIADESIELAIQSTVSSHIGYTPNQGVPMIARSFVESVVDVGSDRAAVLGGLTRTSMVETRSGVPLLKDIPGVRFLFSREVRRQHKSHIVVSVIPRMVTHNSPAMLGDARALPETTL